MTRTVNSYVPLSVLTELRDCIEKARTKADDRDDIWHPLNRAAAIVKVYLMPRLEVRVQVEDDTAAEHENHRNHMREVSRENTPES